jgi:hypothetical protein
MWRRAIWNARTHTHAPHARRHLTRNCWLHVDHGRTWRQPNCDHARTHTHARTRTHTCVLNRCRGSQMDMASGKGNDLHLPRYARTHTCVLRCQLTVRDHARDDARHVKQRSWVRTCHAARTHTRTQYAFCCRGCSGFAGGMMTSRDAHAHTAHTCGSAFFSNTYGSCDGSRMDVDVGEMAITLPAPHTHAHAHAHAFMLTQCTRTITDGRTREMTILERTHARTHARTHSTHRTCVLLLRGSAGARTHDVR